MWDLSRPGLEPMSPALAGIFLTTAPLGKSLNIFYYAYLLFVNLWYSNFCLLFNLVVYFRIVEFSESFVHLEYKSFIRYIF